MQTLHCCVLLTPTRKTRGSHHLPSLAKSRQWHWGIFLICCLIVAISLLSISSHSKASSDSEELPFLDYWDDIQTYMNKKGVTFQTINTLDMLGNVSGGVRQKTAVTGDLDLLLILNGEKLVGWNDSTLFFYGLGVYGEDPSDNIGDAQTVSSIAAPSDWKLFEAWYQQNFFQDRVSLLTGLYDVTSEFDVIRSSSELFLNSSFGTGPEFASSGRDGPSTFPTTSLAFRAQAILREDLAIRAVIADGIPGNPNDPGGTQVILRQDDGLLIATELAYYDLRERKKRDPQTILKQRPLRLTFQRVGRAAPMVYQGKYALGLWGYTTDFNDLHRVENSGGPVKRDGMYGIYGLAEHIVYREPQDREQNLSMFARIGFSDPRVNRFSQYYGGGMVYRGLIPSRNDDEVGIGVAAALNGSHFKRAQRNTGIPVSDAEIALEMTYAINVSPELVIQPTMQYILNPNTNPTIRNAFVVGARLAVNLNWFEGPTTSVEIQK